MESSPQFTAVEPVRPPAPYIGGKRYLSRRLVPIIEAIPHRTYAEPFVGMGGVFLRRRLRPQAEVINDWSRDVATLFRVVQVHHRAFLDLLRFQLTSRAEFERLCAVDPDTLTDMQRAARFLYIQKITFGGAVASRSFGVSAHRPARLDMSKVGRELEGLHERIAGVIIERLPYDAFILRYDRPETLFYIDPPYWGSEGDYGPGLFSRADFERLRDLLAALKGRFVLSLNDRPEVRALFARFAIQPVELSYGIAAGRSTVGRELIITGGGKG